MPRVTNAQAAARRQQVLELWIRGANPTRIAATLHIDWETARRDLALLGTQGLAELDVPRELLRLLRGAQALEVAGWGDKQYGVVLGAQRSQVAILQTVQALGVAERLERLEAQMAALTGEAGGASLGAVLNGAAHHPGGAP